MSIDMSINKKPDFNKNKYEIGDYLKKIEISEYNPRWEMEYEALKGVYKKCLSGCGTYVIEHVGSTAVKGMWAKPVIDIDIIFSDAIQKKKMIKQLEEIGYINRGNLGLKGREAFSRKSEKVPYNNNQTWCDHHLYVVEKDSDALKNHLMLRDFLRKDRDSAKKYSRLKIALAKKFPYDMDRYVEGKTEFITSILREAGMNSTSVEGIKKANIRRRNNMKYSVEQGVFDKNSNVVFGVIIGNDLKNTSTSEEDSNILKIAENLFKERISIEDLKANEHIAIYRDALKNAGINPNKYMNSVEAMGKRVLKGGSLPRINALVDLCNAIALTEVISLGAHDLVDIDEDLSVRISEEGDIFLPFGEEEFEEVLPGELVFTSGNKVQTRQWLWRQSELGKISEESSQIFFQLVGFEGENYYKLENAMKALEKLISERFHGTCESFLVNKENPIINF
ncbi:MAG: GrpB family protein [Clostridiales bacterium]|nr:GrpB family protein [Clostridiales bacterium]